MDGRPLGTYYTNIIRECFANYLALVEKDCPKINIFDLSNRELVWVRGVTIDISTRMLNWMLYRPDNEAPTIVPELKHYLTMASIQRPWLSRLLNDDGNSSWSLNTKKRIAKLSLNLELSFGGLLSDCD